jgi:hypothetical protein
VSLRTYALFGLTVVSEVALPELAAASPDAAADAVVRRDRIALPAAAPGYAACEDGATLLTVPDVGRFLIRDGREIVVDAPFAPERNMRLFLLGSVFGALLHQRGLMPLHANAVVLEGRAFAFCGHSGAGKSTMAAWFHDRGAPILADDVCVIGFDAGGAPQAFPGIPRLRLWRQALEETGRLAEDFDRSFDALDKYDVPLSPPNPDPEPLAAIYLLDKAAVAQDAGTIERLTGVAAVETLVSNTYRGAYLRTIGGTGAHLAACARIARSVPVFRAARLWGFEAFDGEARRLETHARSLLQGVR